jgi:hypothetical protein
MKLVNLILLSITLFLTISVTFTVSKSHRSHKSHRSGHRRSLTKSQSTYWIKPLIKSAKSFLAFANLAYCNSDVINNLACPLCDSLLDGSYQVKDVYSGQQEKQTYRYVVLVSDVHREVVLSFSGPKSTDNQYYASLYTSGWSNVQGQKVEKTYAKVYENVLGAQLQNSIRNLLSVNPSYNGYKFLFIGHSFGGSMAVLSAFDLVKSGIVQRDPSQNSPLVYSYGLLRIGDDKFVEEVNTLFKVIRINKTSDHMTRLPNCVWSEQVGKWRCYRDTYNLMMRYPEYRQYIMNYGTHNGKTQHYTGLQAAYGGRRSFLEKSSKVNKRSKSKRGYYYSARNPGYKTYSYGSTLTNQGSSQYGNVYYSQPLGAEVLFSNTFKKFQVCSYFNGIPNCEQQLPRRFNSKGHANYYGNNVEDC